jgi:hypothetical protein
MTLLSPALRGYLIHRETRAADGIDKTNPI